MAFGAAWGREKTQKMLAEDGFTEVTVGKLEQDILNRCCPVPKWP